MPLSLSEVVREPPPSKSADASVHCVLRERLNTKEINSDKLFLSPGLREASILGQGRYHK